MSGRNSRSRSPRGSRRGGPRRSPPQFQDRNNGMRRSSQSRSGSRGREARRMGGGSSQGFGNGNNDGGVKRRNKFSDPGAGGGGFSSGFNDGHPSHDAGRGGYGGHMYEMASVPGHGGFQNDNPAVNYNNNYNNSRNPPPPQQPQQPQQQINNYEMDRHPGPPPQQSSAVNQYQISFSTPKPPQPDNVAFDPSIISIIAPQRGPSKISRKVYIPMDDKFNYIGLIIGPKGSNQKQLEEDTNCKILIRGKGSQKAGQPPQPDDDQDLHVLIETDNEMSANKAMSEIEKIILMDEEQKAKKRDQQLRTAQTYNGGGGRPNEFQCSDPDKLNYIIVPNSCVGLVIGRKGETIKQIRERAGAERVYMQSETNRNFKDDFQNLIVEGTLEAVEKVREIIEDIKSQQGRKTGGGGGDRGDRNDRNDRGGDRGDRGDRGNDRGDRGDRNDRGDRGDRGDRLGGGGGNGPLRGGHSQNGEARVEMEVPANMAGLVIGKQGSTLQQVGQQTRTHCQMMQNNNPDGKKILVITGPSEDDCQQAKAIFQDKINARVNGMSNNNGPRFQGPPGGGYGGMPPRMPGQQQGGYPNHMGGGGGGRPPFGGGRRPRKNADGDEIIEDTNQYEYYGGYEAVDPMQQMYATGMYMPQQYQQYALPPAPAELQKDAIGVAYPPQDGQQLVTEPPKEGGIPDQGAQQLQYQQMGYDQMQLQMQMQYQQQLYYQQMQQMQMQQMQQPMIQEVLADGTVVSISQEEEDSRKGKRGGRR